MSAKKSKNICTNIYKVLLQSVVLHDHNYIIILFVHLELIFVVLFCVISIVFVPTPRVGVSLKKGSQFGNIFLSFRSHCLAGSLFAGLMNRTYVFPVHIYE